jgi:hypothetical protein
VIKLVLVALAILFLLPLLRRREPKDAAAQKKRANADDAEAKREAPKLGSGGAFDALMRTVVVLVDNDWSACTVDGKKEDWPRYASDAVRGFSAIPAGRHRVVTRVGERDVTLDFVVFAGEVLVRKLDGDGARWVELDAEALAVEEARAAGGEKGALADALVSYRSTMGIARVMSGGLASPEVAFERARDALEGLVARASGADVDALVAEARAVGESLIGIALVGDQLTTLVALARRDPTARIVDAALPGIARAQTPRDS